MYHLYPTDKEYQQHLTAIQTLAHHYHLEESLIRDIYEEELESLQKQAKVKHFLSVLVTRHVIDNLLKARLITL